MGEYSCRYGAGCETKSSGRLKLMYSDLRFMMAVIHDCAIDQYDGIELYYLGASPGLHIPRLIDIVVDKLNGKPVRVILVDVLKLSKEVNEWVNQSAHVTFMNTDANNVRVRPETVDDDTAMHKVWEC